jgi:hypothetical protein
VPRIASSRFASPTWSSQIAVVDDDVQGLSTWMSATWHSIVGRFQYRHQDDMPGYYGVFPDEWGIGWKMPKAGGFYYDMFHHP